METEATEVAGIALRVSESATTHCIAAHTDHQHVCRHRAWAAVESLGRVDL